MNKITREEFIRRAHIKHKGVYNYIKCQYIADNIKCCIVCNKHGEFMQSPGAHVRQGQGCPKCKAEQTSSRCLNEQRFISKLKLIFGDLYSPTEKFCGAHKKINFKCNKHNIIFKTHPATLYSRKIFACPICSKENNIYAKNSVSRGTDFIHNSKLAHGDKYDYCKVVYLNTKHKVIITCPIHGDFIQTPSDHLYGKSGCPICSMPHGEKIIGIILNKMNIEYIFQYRVRIDDSFHYFDFYLPKYKTIISFNGMQHYKPVKFFGGCKGFKLLQERDKIKNQYCVDNLIKHIIIRYEQMNEVENILKSNV